MSKIGLYANDKLGNPTFADVDAMKCRGGAKSSPSGEREGEKVLRGENFNGKFGRQVSRAHSSSRASVRETQTGKKVALSATGIKQARVFALIHTQEQ